ncbi:SGNH/GDSL hydrolase family protein [Micromonospora sp. NPDC023966]|uniref:SGNH/GDSL hydrolase family protein n=1 Tax=Micromonospora sp. NPDC023966 TaxID=3154699 RepID=UPI0033FC81EB
MSHSRKPLVTTGLAIAAGLTTVAALTGPVAAEPGSDASTRATSVTTDQVVTWGASADRTGGSFTDQTVRNIVHTSIGGTNLRISLSNVFGDRIVTFDSVYVGVQSGGASVVPGTNRQVTFAGSKTVSVPNGAEVLSDPLPGDVPADTNLTVSIHVKGASGSLTGHNLAMQTNYISGAGDHAADTDGTAFTQQATRWYWVDALVVDQQQQVDTVAALGDSITDGYGSTRDANHRWPDYLARRIAEQPPAHQFGVMNEGISGNRVLTDGAGVNVQARFDRDVLSQPDVRTVILMEGINDIGGGVATSADQLISAYRILIARAHADQTCILGATLTPFEGAGYYSPAKEVIREEVNTWIRTSGEFDGVIDFDQVTRDPANPMRFLPAYDVGDHLHPSDAGYQAMANAVDLSHLECKR